MFEQATRLKLRFTHKGLCSVEDLWDLSLSSLDGIFKSLNKQAKTLSEDSLLVVKSSENKILTLKINIIKYIVEVRMKEELDKTSEAKKFEKKQAILGLIKEKQYEGLRNKSIDDLQNIYKELE